ncbi:LegC family aminotransferase [Desulfovibrio psychrotolerans]|uniref:GDP-perosamine synthase n=1 Tax=Desulfovibrio psychrotolerans TaxID=415242 RepID=A0A7J0BYP4_9BACT|nr:LegC family aminotransferase [Desulfovibrio psychrotolerans]GFM38104.1 perosamine synthetase [Desulfovibrio psychrotolerans]
MAFGVVKTIIQALHNATNQCSTLLSLHEPTFAGNEWTYVKETIDTGWVSTAGKYVNDFEVRLQEYTGAKRAIAVANGTAALHVALLLAGVERDTEVIMPALTFAATAAAAAYIGAVPHFADSEYATLGMDPDKLAAHLDAVAERRGNATYNRQTGRRIAAIVPMHTFGHPVRLDELCAVCEKWGIVMVEDSAESLGSFYKGKHTGLFGKLGILSFNGNKTITTGGGGAILTDDDALGDLAKHITTTAKLPHKWEYVHDMVGFNYRMPNLNAALGCAQMEQLPGFLQKKRTLAERYIKAFAGVDGVSFAAEPADSVSNYWLNAILLDKADMALREDILEKTNAAGFMTRPAWRLMNRLPMYAGAPRMDLSVAEDLEARLINIPSGAGLAG